MILSINPIVIDSEKALEHVARTLEEESHIAIDTESNGFYAYFERICLIQISTKDADYVIDTLAMDTLEPLASVLANPRVEKIFHAASNDILGLKRDFSFRFENLFDTAVACKMLGYRRLGLASVLKLHFGIELNKKWQRFNWGKRPLASQQLRYACFDTHFLIPLRDLLASELLRLGLWNSAQRAFSRLCTLQAPDKGRFRNGYYRIRGFEKLDDAGKRILKFLYKYRDRLARTKDRAPFRIMSNETLVRLATLKPQSERELLTVKGIPRSCAKEQMTRQILKIITAALQRET